jgi:hypothetical protein
LGLVAGDAAHSRSESPVAERRPHEGRVLNVVDPRRLLARASALVEESLSGDKPQGETQ